MTQKRGNPNRQGTTSNKTLEERTEGMTRRKFLQKISSTGAAGLTSLILPTTTQAKEDRNSIPIKDSYKTNNLEKENPTMLLARMLYGEARGSSDVEKAAIAYTPINRAEDGERWNGTNLKGAILADNQYIAMQKPHKSERNYKTKLANHQEVKNPSNLDEFIKSLVISHIVQARDDLNHGAKNYARKGIHRSWMDDMTKPNPQKWKEYKKKLRTAIYRPVLGSDSEEIINRDWDLGIEFEHDFYFE